MSESPTMGRDFDINWLTPWEPVADGEALEAELRRELRPEHELRGQILEVIGWHPHNLDALVWLPNGSDPFAIVHFGWRNHSFEELIEKPGMPELVGAKELVNVIAGTEFFDNLMQVQVIIDRDHRDWTEPQPPFCC